MERNAPIYHGIVSEYVHIVLHIVPARAEQPYHVIVTTGMSDRPMKGPDGQDRYCELLLALPPGLADSEGAQTDRKCVV